MKKFAIITTLLFSTYFCWSAANTARCTVGQLSTDLQGIKSELGRKADNLETRLGIKQIETKLRTVTSDIKSRILSLQSIMLASSLKYDKRELKLAKLTAKIEDIMSTKNSSKTLTPINDTVSLSNLESKVAEEPDTPKTLTVEYLSTKLPEPNSCPTAFYDGKDSIYLFGGCLRRQDDIFKFSISSETIVRVGLMVTTIRGTVQGDKFGNIFYFGAVGGTYIQKFEPTRNATEMVFTIFPYSVRDSISIKVNKTFVVVFGGDGQDRKMMGFNMEKEFENVLPEIGHNFNQGSAARVGNKVYIFDDTESTINQGAFELDLQGYRLIPVGPQTLPIFGLHPSSVWDENGRNIYIIGGYNSSLGHPTGGLIQFNPATYENKFIPVQNFPVQDSDHFHHAPASVFVPSLNKIYFFGGQTFNHSSNTSTAHDEIFTIDLTPLTPNATSSAMEETDIPPRNPEFFSCANRANGIYPHESDCSAFLGCHNEAMTMFNCPSPLNFNTKKKSCEKVECGTSCKDRADGSYPHSHDCSLFIICRSEVMTVFKCPPPLFFAPGNLRCDFPDVANCSIASG